MLMEEGFYFTLSSLPGFLFLFLFSNFREMRRNKRFPKSPICFFKISLEIRIFPLSVKTGCFYRTIFWIPSFRGKKKCTRRNRIHFFILDFPKKFYLLL